ncbi:ribosome assembly cofactor RimP [Ancylomarina salipaludis]|uniref:Ribosome maturation factor RimP n=1 Tax=Ancylomarina salipaludis TaxID=2501299 RepID=A0A4Q1JKF0_9BACT|nr:ribosome assembly cofactor RimP [Ancylomarina salipaludis]RXQ93045.1 ribosome assembly cofactor RimP [Ancylomarina salipaludis]
MIDKKTIQGIIEKEIENTDLYLVETKVSSNNTISVMIDSLAGVPISTCIELSRAIEGQLDREIEDFELQVSSAGIGQTFQVIQQYHKNIGKEVEVLTTDGNKFNGKLLVVGENEIEVEIEELVKVEGKKKKQLITKTLKLNFEQIKSTKDIITF